MCDPFVALKQVLIRLFYCESNGSKRNGEYLHKEIGSLEEAVRHYNSENRETFKRLLRALRAALPYVEKWDVPVSTIISSVDSLNKQHALPPIHWDWYFSRPNTSKNFQYGDKEIELIPWLTQISGSSFSNSPPRVQAQILIQYHEHPGFSKKLSAHLKHHPEFLFNLLMESENDFSDILKTRLILYLTDKQIAKTIIKFIPKLVQDCENSFVKVEKLISKINALLSNGQSISTLLRNAEAKPILDLSEFFRIYQSEEYKNRTETSFFSLFLRRKGEGNQLSDI